MDDIAAFLTVLLIAVLCLFGGCAVGRATQERRAVEAGVAEYYLDAEYQRQFRYITNKKPAAAIDSTKPVDSAAK